MTPPPDLLEAAKAILPHVFGHYAGDPTYARARDAFERAIAHEEGLRANARIRTEPFPPTRTHDAAGTLRTGYRPEHEDEVEE